MILQTTLKELDDFVYKYNGLLGWADGSVVECDKRTRLGISGYRIQIPSLSISLRDGDIMSQHGESYECHKDPITGNMIETKTPAPDNAEWELDASCVVIYDLGEKDVHQYLGWTTNDYEGTVYDYFYPKFNSMSEFNDIPCFIDTSDFIECEEDAQQYAKECEEYYEESFEYDKDDN